MVSTRPEEAAASAARRAAGPVRHGPSDEKTVTGRPSARCRPRVGLDVTGKPLQCAYEVSCRVRVGDTPGSGIELHPKDLQCRPTSGSPSLPRTVEDHGAVAGLGVRTWASAMKGARSRSDATHANPKITVR